MRPNFSARLVPPAALLTVAVGVAAGLLAGCTQNHGPASSSSAGLAQAQGDLASGGKAARPGPSASQAGTGGQAAAAGAGGAPLLSNRNIIFTASITVRTGDIAKAVDAVSRIAADADGLVYDEQVDLTPKESGKPGSVGRASATVTLKVPPPKLDAVLDAVGGIGTEVSRTKSSDDVTSKVVDVDARIQAARASIARLTDLLAHAGNVSDLLAVESQLSSRDAQLESLEQQQKTLQAQTSQATVTVRLQATPPVVLAAHEATTPGFLRGLVGGWHAFAKTVSALLTATGAVLPFAVVLGALAAAVLIVRRRLHRHPQES
jgi:hypothetical protein